MSPRGIPLFCVAFALVGCEIPNPGIPPVPATLNFPIAVELSDPAAGQTPGEPDYLLVVNANFDARYNQGTILSLDMRRIMERFADVRANGRAPDPTNTAHLHWCSNPAAWDNPTVECQIADAVDVMADGRDPLTHDGAEAWIDSFAARIVRSPQGDRFYIPTRGSADLTWIDFDNATGAINCEQADGSFRCSERRRTTSAETQCGTRNVTLTGDPTGLVAMSMASLTGNTMDLRDVLVMTQRNGTAALFIDQPGDGGGREPRRTHILTGLPLDSINSELEPSTGLAWLDTASPVATRATRVLARVGVFIDQEESCSQLFAAPSVFLDGLATGFDTRDVAFSSDPNSRFAYVLSRSPEAVITIDQQGTPFVAGTAAIVDVDDVCFGPSRLRRFTMDGRDFLVVTCFDGRAVEVLSTEPTQLVSIVPGFDGAFELTIDSARRLAIVTDFKTSVIRFIDLAPVLSGHDAVVLGRVGTPRTHVGFP